MRTAIIIPAFNESATIARVVHDVRSYGTTIVVDDCSDDDTGSRAQEAGAVVVRHEANRGYDGALQTGFEWAAAESCEAVVTFDADGQHEARILDELLDPIATDDADLVLGVRPGAARFSERLFNLYGTWRFGVPDLLCGLKAYRMALYHAHGRFDGTRSIGTELTLSALRGGARVRTQPVPVLPRHGAPRFGSGLRANGRILRALGIAISSDIAHRTRRLGLAKA